MVSYKLNGANSAYLMILGSYGTTNSPAPARIPSRGKLKNTKNPAFAGFSLIFFYERR